MQATPPYQILKTLYDGNEGPIYLIRDSKKKQYVMKKYQYTPSDYGIDPGLLIELMILKKFKGYPHLLQLDHIEYRRGEVNIIVEKLDDEISELILDRPSVPEIKDYMRQILGGLKILHEHGVFHNDLKPLNIMFSRQGKNNRPLIKIIDFGLSHFVSYPYYRARNIKTTHHFTPPEYKAHREIGRISVNSDMFSLGIIFFYMISPRDYDYLDDDPDHDNIFDPHHVNWERIEIRIGKSGADLLHKMLDYNPEKRITSSKALNHPFLHINSPQRGGATRRRRWEEPHLMIEEEYLNQRNQTEFLDRVVVLAEQEKIKVNPQQKIPNFIWNLMYDYFDELKIKFITLNYAIYLLMWYLTYKQIRQDQWESLALGCLFISMKLNQYDMNSGVRIFHAENEKIILKFEEEISKIINFAFPLPLLITKEVILYREYLDIIYRKSRESKIELIGNIYNQYYIFNLISSLTYTDPKLILENKRNLIKVILSFHYPIHHSSQLRTELIQLIKSRRHLSWIDNTTLEFIGLNTSSSRRRSRTKSRKSKSRRNKSKSQRTKSKSKRNK